MRICNKIHPFSIDYEVNRDPVDLRINPFSAGTVFRGQNLTFKEFCHIIITYLKLWLADAIHNFKWAKIIKI